MLKSLSREFGLKSKENSQQLCQTKLRSLDDLLESSSEEEESGDRSSQSDNKQDSESDQDNEPPIPDFKYGNNFDLNLPRELSQIFQSRGLTHTHTHTHPHPSHSPLLTVPPPSEDLYWICKHHFLPRWHEMTKRLLPSSVGSSFYQILCTESDQSLLQEISETLCSLWTESLVMVDFTLTRSDLNLALSLFLSQLKSKDRKCLKHCNLRHWLRFLASLLTVQTKAGLREQSLISAISSPRAAPLVFVGQEDLLWLLEGFLTLASDITIMDLYGTTDSSEEEVLIPSPRLASPPHRY
jgi:hypothetical protein